MFEELVILVNSDEPDQEIQELKQKEKTKIDRRIIMDVDENGYLLNEDGYWTFRGYTEREILTRDIYSCHPLAYERYEKGQPDTKKTISNGSKKNIRN
ncbi:hypothetical protein QYZ43_24185 [Vibrio parahaemolyticus]|nr:hypothetical protein [Vibrio parahaemolyticus]MDN4719984.1 hypothetical protein [Vibrio parahaemolyticus]